MSRRRRSRRGHGDAGAEAINVTPLIDIVMVLIIFYLMVGSFISSDYADVPLPLAMHGEPGAAAEVFTINVLADDPAGAPGSPARVRTRILVQGVETDEAGVARALRDVFRAHPDTVVQLRAARDLPYRAVEPVALAAAQAGASTIRLVTESAQ
ncbi:MAG: biopolymer transporter ExbD [Phycisphaerales bacterium]|nr:biopolymer transporter ExbD [Phycisphaerales bacterium]